MENSLTAAEELKQLAGRMRSLAELMVPLPHVPDVDRLSVIKHLLLIARDLDRVAVRTDMCPTCRQDADRGGQS